MPHQLHFKAFMTTGIDDLRFTEDHEWLRKDAEGTVVVGITDHAQSALGDLVFVQLPAVGSHYDAGVEMAVIESVKAAGAINAPLAGSVIEVNESLIEDPSKVNNDPMNEGWFVKLKLDVPGGLADLMTADAYSRLLQGQS